MSNQTIDGVWRETGAALEKARDVLRAIIRDKAAGVHYASAQAACHQISGVLDALRALLDAKPDARAETVPKHKFDTLVQHCKRLDGEIAQARANVNEITLYQKNEVWFWQHDGQDFLESLSCPIIIQPHQLRELLKGVVPAAQTQGDPVAYLFIGGPVGKGRIGKWLGFEGKAPSNWNPEDVTIKPLYAEQPAPVAEQLIERLAQRFPDLENMYTAEVFADWLRDELNTK